MTRQTDRDGAVVGLIAIDDALKFMIGDEVLYTVVGKAQNAPPLGESDGTLVGLEWEVARDVCDAARRLRHAISRARRTFSL